MEMLSVILPAFNEEKMIKIAGYTLSQILESENIEYELIFVNDGSKDATWSEIEKLGENDRHIRGISFSKNFGKEAAILAGLAGAVGECCVVMDCDLQHPPKEIISMYYLWKEGFEIVEGIKKNRGREDILYKAAANMFYKIISSTTKIDMSNASDFKLLDRKVVNVILAMPERHPFFRALSSWVGFKKTTIEFEVQERLEGQSKWSIWSLIKYAISNITSFSAVPLQIVTILGAAFFVFSIVLGIQTLYRYVSGRALEGFTTVIVLLLLIGSILMISMGIIGYYLFKIFEEVRMRPRYIISKEVNEK